MPDETRQVSGRHPLTRYLYEITAVGNTIKSHCEYMKPSEQYFTIPVAYIQPGTSTVRVILDDASYRFIVLPKQSHYHGFTLQQDMIDAEDLVNEARRVRKELSGGLTKWFELSKIETTLLELERDFREAQERYAELLELEEFESESEGEEW